jgi:hypothetical protein
VDWEKLAAAMLTLVPTIEMRTWLGSPRDYAMAVWVGRLYGYDLDVDFSRVVKADLSPTARFSRVDEPSARRHAEWMRNPAADPTYPPPVAWHLNGGPGFHPPGWHPATRLVITTDVARSLQYNEDQFERRRRAAYGFGDRPSRRRDMDLPPGPPPPPPPDTIAYPDQDRNS